MTRAPGCPPVEKLESLVLGRLPESKAQQLDQHLTGCPRCLETIEALQAKDTLGEALQGSSAVAGKLEDLWSDAEALIRRLQALRPPAGATPVPPSPLPDRIGRYRILEVVGAGGMGTVYKARDDDLQRVVALKVPHFDGLPPNQAVDRQRFLGEARLVARVRHPHVCPIYDVGEHDGKPYVVMAFVEGRSLADRLAEGRRFDDPAEAVTLVCQVAEALEAVHGHGIVHRDLKPGNVLLNDAGQAVLTDFGLARPTADAEHLTDTGGLLGTPAYMAPEQAAGAVGEVGPRTDLYSLGVMLYRMLTGRLPFEGDVAATVYNIVHEEPPPPSAFRPDLDPALEKVVRKAMAHQPKERYASARELAGALRSWLAGRDDGTTAAPPGARPATRGPRRTAPAVVAAGVLLAVLLPIGYFFGGQVIRVATNRGQLVIRVNDPKAEVTVKENGAVVQDRQGQREITLTAGEHELGVTIKDAAGEIHFFARKVTLKRGGKEVLDFVLEPARAKPSVGQDRKAAEWALSLGARVGCREEGSDADREIVAGGKLPTAAFRLSLLDLHGKTQARDGGLAHLKGLSDLKQLDLSNTQVTSVDLAHLTGLRNLEWLSLGNTRLSDDGLVHLAGLTNLTTLYLNHTHVTDAGLAHLKGLTKLTRLFLNQTRVTDSGLERLKGLARLVDLNIAGTQATDSGLERLRALPNLRELWLNYTAVTNAGLAKLASLTELTGLELAGTKVTDAGLAHLKDRTGLTRLGLADTSVTDGGLGQLKGLTRLTQLTLGRSKKVTDGGLPHLRGMTNLTELDLQYTGVTDQGLVHLQGLTRLGSLNLDNTAVTGKGLAHLKDLAHLKVLSLNGTRVTDESVSTLEGFKRRLTTLDVQNTRLSAQGVAVLRGAAPQVHLRWSEPNHTAAQAVLRLGGRVHVRARGKGDDRLVRKAADLPEDYFSLTRASLPGIRNSPSEVLKRLGALRDAEFDRLESLDLSGTAIRDADLAHLKGLPNLRRLILDGAPIVGSGLTSLKELPVLTELGLGCPTLTDLLLDRLGEPKRLERLSLADSRVTDAGLKHLRGLAALQELNLTGSKVSAQGVSDLRKALPKCRVVTDHKPEW